MLHVFDILAIIPFLWAAFWYVAPTVALSIGMMYLGQALFGQDIKEPGQPEDTHGRMWNPHTTQKEGLVRPRCYGRNMHHGNVIAKWTDVDGDDREILYLMLEHGDGPTKGNVAGQIWIDDQPITNFGSVVVQERKGTMDQTCMTGFEKNKLPYPLNKELRKADEGDPYTWTTPNKFFDDIEYTICFPDGLIKYRENGATTNHSIHLRVRIREYPAGDWVTLIDSDFNYQRTKPLFLKYIVNTQEPGTVIRGKQYTMEFKRTSEDGQVRRRDKSFIRSVREVVDVAFTHPGKALTGIKAIATAQLSGNLDVKIIRDDRLINVWEGGENTIEHSRNRAWVVFDLVTQPVIKGNVGTWEVARYEGANPLSIDMNFFFDWADFCSDEVQDGYDGTEDRLACDIKVDYLTDVWTIVNEIATVGRAHLYWAGNTLTGWIDKEVTAPTDLVTMDTIMARSWQNHWVGRDELSGLIEVWYYDKRLGYERTTAVLPKATAGTYTRPISIEGVGITTYGTAIHVANHALTRNALVKNINGFRQFRDGFRHKLGEVIRLQHRTPRWGQGYRVVNVPTASTMTLDRKIEDVNVDDLLYVRSYDEANEKVDISVYTVASTSGMVITIAETWSPTPIKNNIAAIGVDGKIVKRRIVKIEATVENYFDVEVETYDAALYAADDLDPNAPNKGYIWTQPPGTLTKPITHDDVLDLMDQFIPPFPNIDMPQISNCDWTGDDVDTITWSAIDEEEPITFSYRGITYEITAFNTDEKYVYWDIESPTIFQSTDVRATAFGLGKWMVRYNYSGVPYPALLEAPIPGQLVEIETIDTSKLVDLSVTTAKLAALNVTLAKLAANSVSSTKIVNSAVTTAKINALAVTAAKIAAHTITAAKIAAGTITTTEIAALTILAGDIAANAITAAKINALAVETGKIAALAVTADKIAANTITAAEIAANTITANQMAALSIATAALQAGCITAASGAIDDLAVTTAKINDLAVETVKIKDQAVTLMVAAYTATQGYYVDSNWHEAQTITMTTTGAPVALWAAVQWKNVGDSGCNIRVQRDNDVNIYSTNMNSIAQFGNPFSIAIVDDSPDAGEHTYDFDIATTPKDIGDPKIWFKNRSLIGQEVKK